MAWFKSLTAVTPAPSTLPGAPIYWPSSSIIWCSATSIFEMGLECTITSSDVFACLRVAIAGPDLDILLLICWLPWPIIPMQLFSLSLKSFDVPAPDPPPMIPLPIPEIAAVYAACCC